MSVNVILVAAICGLSVARVRSKPTHQRSIKLGTFPPLDMASTTHMDNESCEHLI